MNGRIPLIAFAVAACLLSVSAGALAQESPPAIPDNVHLDIVMDSPANATAYVQQQWTGDRAQALRESLDVYFGAADGVLTPDELDRIREAAASDMRGKTLPWMWADEGETFIDNVTITFVNATGTVESMEPIEMTHQMTLSIRNVTEADQHEILVAPMWNGTISLQAPAGWGIQNATGVEEPTMDVTTASGAFTSGNNLRFQLVPEDQVQQPEPGENGGATNGTQESASPPGASTIPAPSLVAAGLAVAAAALVAARRRTRR